VDPEETKRKAFARLVLLVHVLFDRDQRHTMDTPGALTLAVHSIAIDGSAADHDIVHDREAALAADPITLAILDTAVRKHRGLVEPHATVMELLCDGDLVRVEEIPY
jgi:hypothetical protein